jgi:hypothetical protein
LWMNGKRRTDCSRPSLPLSSWGRKTDSMNEQRSAEIRRQQLKSAFQNQLAYAEDLIKNSRSEDEIWNAFTALFGSHKSLINYELPTSPVGPRWREDKVKELFTLIGNMNMEVLRELNSISPRDPYWIRMSLPNRVKALSVRFFRRGL